MMPGLTRDKQDCDRQCRATGPLAGLRVVEMAGLGPGPFCGMLLADLGAEVLRIARPEQKTDVTHLSTLQRGKATLELNLKDSLAIEKVLSILEKADVLLEGFRPGVMERLGLGPEACFRRNGKLVYGRMTGWGQDGPLSSVVGHDLNYIGLSGALAAIGIADTPVPPLNLIGDFGGGALYLAVGVLAALRSIDVVGKGQVVDAAMVDGSAHLMTPFYGLLAEGQWHLQRQSNFIDGAAHFYGVYRTLDRLFVSVAAIEPAFYQSLVHTLDLEKDLPLAAQWDRFTWAKAKTIVAAAIAQRSRDELVDLFSGKGACVSAVLDMSEAINDSHNIARKTFVNIDGIDQPAPAPRFSRTPTSIPLAARSVATGAEVVARWGCAG